MKLPAVKKRKIAVIFTGGLGDTLLYVPLLKELKKKQFHITAIFYGEYENDCLFDKNLADRKVYINTKARLLLFAIQNTRTFINFFINHLAKGKGIRIAAGICSTHITQTGDSNNNPHGRKRIVPVEALFSYAEQNLNLLYTAVNARIKNISSFYFEHAELNRYSINHILLTVKPAYFVVQVSSGNNKTPFKNWPLTYWNNIIKRLCDSYPDISFLLVGDKSETQHTPAFKDLEFPNCKILIGQTSVSEIFNLVAFSKGYIGLDSGIMHMAAALQKKTLSIFGASNEKLLAYSGLDCSNHAIVTSPLSCRPCSSWKNANTSRVTDPLKCPDFACLANIKEEEVYQKIVEHFGLNS